MVAIATLDIQGMNTAEPDKEADIMTSGRSESFQLSSNISELLFFSDFNRASRPDKHIKHF